MKNLTKLSFTFAMVVGLTGGALAGDPKTGGAPAPTKEKTADAPKEAPKKMEPMKAPQELTDMAKHMAGTWKCTGKAAMDPSKPGEMADMKATMKFKSDLGGWWINGTLDSAMFKGQMWITYDPMAKKYYQFMMDSMGGSETRTSTGTKDGKSVWEGDARSPMPGMGAAKARETDDMTDPKAVKMTGEYSMDGGKTWVKGWETTCKK